MVLAFFCRLNLSNPQILKQVTCLGAHRRFVINELATNDQLYCGDRHEIATQIYPSIGIISQ